MRRLLIVLALLAAPNVAWAQPERNLEAVRLGREALGAFERGDWASAHAGFASAEALAHSPVFVLYMARARRNAGALLEARDLFARVAAESVAASAPEPWRAAVGDAATELGELAGRIPSIVVEPRPLAPGETIVVDGATLAPERLGGEIELDPGTHQLALRRVDAAPIEKAVTLAEGTRRVVVAFEAEPTPPPTPAPPPPAAPTVSRPSFEARRDVVLRDRENPYATAATISGVVGLAGVAVGSVAGIVALGKASDAKQNCVDDVCPPENERHRDAAYDFATVSTLGFIVGGVGIATSATLFWVVPSLSAKRGTVGVALGANY